MISFSKVEWRFTAVVGSIEAVFLAVSQVIEWLDRSIGAIIWALVLMPSASALLVIGAIITVFIVRRRGGELRLDVAIGCAIGIPVAAAVANACSLSIIKPSYC